MSNRLQFDSFQCKSVGCSGILAPDTARYVCLQVGCHSSASAVVCPVCKRLHWPNGGNPVRNRQNDNAFLDSNGFVEHQPMPAAEKNAFVKEYIGSLKPESSEVEMACARDDFNSLIGKGHAPDCPAKDSKGDCNCGNSDAEKWITEHPEKEVAPAE